jgi:acyl transferase domain-containing protein/acyl carrier protein/SAM-dependent methyltransferase
MNQHIVFRRDNPVLTNHRAYGRELMPGLSYIDIVLQFFQGQGHDATALSLRNMALYRPLIVPESGTLGVNVKATEAGYGWKVEIADDEGTLFVSVEAVRAEPAVFSEYLDLPALHQPGQSAMDIAAVYERCRAGDMVHDGFMKAAGTLFERADDLVAELETPACARDAAPQFLFHPTLLDASSLATGMVFAEHVGASENLFLPLSLGSFRWSASLRDRCYARVRRGTARREGQMLIRDLDLFDSEGRKVAELRGFACTIVRDPGRIAACLIPPAPAPADDVLVWLRGIVMAQLHAAGRKDVAGIAEDAGFFEIGLDSAMLLAIADTIGRRLNQSLAPTLLFEFTTLRALAAHLRAAGGAELAAALASGAPNAAAAPPPAAASLPAAAAEPIAIIGMAGRYPGAADLAAFWRNLCAGKDCITEIPPTRWDHRAYAHLRSRTGRPISRWGGFIDMPDAFDAPFFRISPREAELMDPQERLFMQTCWEAMEDAGYTPETIAPARGPEQRRNVGVFAGVMHKDYTLVVGEALRGGEPLPLSLNYAQIPNRVSFFCGFHGPSLAVDTVCSSSLVAVHLAVESLRRGETEVCIAGGVNLSLHPAKYITYGQGNLFSTDGRCRAFGAGGDGYVPAEGVGAVVLKPLRQAVADGDPVYAVIRGSAVNHVGHVTGFTVPSPVAQTDLVRRALDQAGINARSIDCVEAHGTGTSLGDPIEIKGLTAAFGADTGDREFCAIGSVKSNIGHAEAAAGISGLTKLALQIHHRTLVPSLHADQTNPHIDFTASPFRVQRAIAPWPATGEARPPRGAVSSFGATGTNAHLVLEGFSGYPAARAEAPQAPVVLPVSAATPAQLRAYAERLRGFLAATPETSLAELAGTFQTGRKVFASRAVFIADDRERLLRDLDSFARGGDVPPITGDTTAAVLARSWLQTGHCAWVDLYGGRAAPRRLHAPTYPFAAERYWAPVPRPAEPSVLLATPIWQPVPGGPAPAPAPAQVQIVAHDGMAMPPWFPAAERDGAGWLDTRGTEFEDTAARLFRDIKARRELAGDARCWQIVTRADAPDELLDGLTGLIRTARLEDPSRQIQCVALEPEAFQTRAAFAAALRGAAERADCVALRHHGAGLETRTWQEVPDTAQAIPWKDGGVYLITGGAGGLGLLFAQEIARRAVAPRIVLAGRSSLDATRRAALDALADTGAVASYHQADIADPAATSRLVTDILAAHGTLNGVIHSAGVLADALIRHKTEEEFRGVLAPKVAGTRNLDAATANLDLDLFVLFSSGAGVFGNPGQADYAAANAWQGGFARQRARQAQLGRRSGRTLAIHWPLWEDGGMRPGEAVERLWAERIGLRPLGTAAGMAAFYRAMATGSAEMLVLCGDAERLRAYFALGGDAPVPLPKEHPAEGPAEADPAPAAAPPNAGELRPAVLSRLKRLLGEIVKVPPERIRADETLETYGLDSVMVVQFGQGLAAVSPDIPAGLLYEYADLNQVAGHLVDRYPDGCLRWSGLAPRPRAASAPPVRADAAPAEPAPAPAIRKVADEAEPIAIIGIAGRYPHAPDLPSLWDNLRHGRDCVGEIPADRWDLHRFYEPDRRTAVASGRSYGKWGGFLEGFADFDPLFFQISPMEAAAMDPQERLFIEIAREVFEEAGYSRDEIHRRHGGRVGVFAGITRTGFNLYALDRWRAGDTMLPATSFSSVANRISYLMNLCGPSMPIDTMCSSSLTAVHEACEHLRRGECEMALAGGVNLYLHPLTYVSASAQQMLSPDGRCKSFGDGANGFVPGEGVGAVLLKPLAAAQRDGDHIHALIRATAINHNGKTTGYTVPNPRAQRDLVRAAIAKAGVDPESITVIEAHGTGTELGDPIEIEGLSEALEARAANRPPCAVGSIKSNIGHLEAAAGIAGLTKIVLQMRNRTIVPSLHSGRINPKIDLAGSALYVPQQAADWLTVEREGLPLPRRAGVSSFGAGGANAHVLLEEYLPPAVAAARREEPVLIVLSARSEAALGRQAAALLAWLDAGAPDLRAVAFTLQVGREAFPERLAIVAASAAELAEALAHVIAGRDSETIQRGNTRDAAAFDMLRDDPDMAALIAGWARQHRLAKIASFWVRGFPVEWRLLYPADIPNRVSLPVSLLERQRFWIEPMQSVPAAVPAAQPAGADVAGLLFRPVWQRTAHAAAPTHAAAETALILSARPADGLAESLAASIGNARCLDLTEPLERLAGPFAALSRNGRVFFVADAPGAEPARPVVAAALELLRSARRAGAGPDGPALCFVTRNATGGSALQTSGAGWHGLSLALSQAGWPAAACDVDEDELSDPALGSAVVRLIAGMAPHPRGELLRIRNGACFARRLVPLARDAGATPPVIRRGGRYVIIGGAGRLGRIISLHLIERHEADVVWIGRAAPAEQAVRERLAGFASAGRMPTYLRADATDLNALRQAVAQIGEVAGVFFAAMDFPPGGPFEVAADDFARAVATKEIGLSNTFEAFRDRALDFLCCFSSTQAYAFSHAGNSAAYAAAIAAGDAAARRAAAEAAFPVGVIHWGFWRAAIAGTILERNSGALQDAEGLACLEASLALLCRNGLDDIVCMRLPFGAARAAVPVVEETLDPVAPNPAGAGLAPVSPASAAGLVNPAAQARFHACATQRLYAILAGMGCFDHPAAPIGEVLQRARVTGTYRRWLEEAFAVLDAAGLAPGEAGRDSMSAALAAWAELEASAADDSLLGPMVRLVARCLDNLPAILRGEVAATDIVFPGGDIGALGGIYEGNAWSEFFNARLADEVVAGIERLRRHEPDRAVRIIEIGAGTGGTTRVVLDRLRQIPGPIHYLYTDVSPAFLRHGRQAFAAAHSFIDFRRWNVEAPPEGQNIDPASYDIAIATNVLHATAGLRGALRHVKAALRRRGVLLLNETVWKTLYGTLTFGLLEGWWAFTDADLRIPGAPLLSPWQWCSLLEEEGFRPVRFLTEPAEAAAQLVIAAESDGWLYRAADRLEEPPRDVPRTLAKPAAPGSHAATSAPPAGDPASALRDVVLDCLSRALHIAPGRIDPQVPFSDYGVDSIVGTQLVTFIGDRLGARLNAAVLYEHTSADRLARHLAKTIASIPAAVEDRAGEGLSVADLEAAFLSGTLSAEEVLEAAQAPAPAGGPIH